jgi:hypothetical protein
MSGKSSGHGTGNCPLVNEHRPCQKNWREASRKLMDKKDDHPLCDISNAPRNVPPKMNRSPFFQGFQWGYSPTYCPLETIPGRMEWSLPRIGVQMFICV